MKVRSSLFLFLSILFFFSCNKDPQSVSLPEFQIVDVQDLPPSNSNQYYLLRTNGSSLDRTSSHEAVLKELIEKGVSIVDAWYPLYSTPCMSPGAVDALVIRVNNETSVLVERQFTKNPDPFFRPNCGVDKFQYYRFNY